MDNLPHEPGTEIKPERPVLLTVLCILTFIGSGLNLFSSLMISLFFATFKEVSVTLAKTMKLPGMDMILGADRLFFIASALLYASAITGAYFMFGLKKAGFHIYTIAQILLVISPMYFFKLNGASVFLDVLLAGAFVSLYSIHLKIMA